MKKTATNLTESMGKYMAGFGGKNRKGEMMWFYYNLKNKTKNKMNAKLKRKDFKLIGRLLKVKRIP